MYIMSVINARQNINFLEEDIWLAVVEKSEKYHSYKNLPMKFIHDLEFAYDT